MKRLPAYPVYLALSSATAFLFSMIFTATSLYEVTIAQLNPLQLVLVGTMLEASIFLCEVPTGVVADVYSRRLSIIIGYFLIGAGFILEGSLPLFGTILLAQVLWGLGYTFTSGATQAWITDEIGEEAATQAFLRGSQFSNVGGLLGMLAGIGLGNVQINLPILLGGALLCFVGVALVVWMPEDGFKPTPREDRNSWQHMLYTFRGGLGMLQQRPALLNIFLIGLFYGLYSEGFDRLWVKHVVEDFTLPALPGVTEVVWIGLIRITGALASLLAVEFVRRKLEGSQPGKMIRVLFALSALLVAGLGTLAVLQGSFWWVLLPLWCINIARSAIEPLYTAWVNQRLDSNVRATVISMSSQVDAIGQTVAGPLMGVVGKLVSVRAALGLSTLILSPILGLYQRVLNKPDQAEQS